MIQLPDIAKELFDIALSRRSHFNESLYYDDDDRNNEMVRLPHIFYNSTTPILDGGYVRKSKCPNERNNFLSVGLQYEWSQDHQELFEATLFSDKFDLRRLQYILRTYRGHWSKTLFGHTGLDAYSPGISEILLDLGKTKFFRTLRLMHWDYDEENKIDSGECPAVTINDDLIRNRGERVEPLYRSRLIAARGMIEYCSQREFFDDFGEISCVVCDEFFWPQLLDEVEIQQLGSPRYCNRCCRLLNDLWSDDFYTVEKRRELAITGLRAAKDLTGTFPHSNLKKEVIASLDDAERDLWFVAQVLLPGKSVKELFGSWNELLMSAGIINEKPRAGRGGIISQSACKHLCLSLGERRICDELFRQGIEHEKEPRYPVDSEYNPNGRLRADWKINEIYIELAGMMSDTSYAENIAKKQRLAKKLEIDLRIVLPAELRNISELVAIFTSS